jgi:hypothetical protein
MRKPEASADGVRIYRRERFGGNYPAHVAIETRRVGDNDYRCVLRACSLNRRSR